MRRTRTVVLAIIAVLALLPVACLSTRPTPRSELRYSFLLSGRPAGEQVVQHFSDGSMRVHFRYEDRGRGPDQTARLWLGAGLVPHRLEITGHDYLKNPVEERFALEGRTARWINAAERGEAAAGEPAYYVSFQNLPEMTALLARALLATPDGRLRLLPAGEARLERLGTTRISLGEQSRIVHQVAVSGLGFSPVPLWVDRDGYLFAGHDGFSTTILAGWEGALDQVVAAQEISARKREVALAARLARKPPAGFAIRRARLFDAESGRVLPAHTVVVEGEHVAAVGPDGEVDVPAGAEVIDAAGKTLLPGLWDLHTHLAASDGLLHIAAGVTTARDLANDMDQLLGLRARWQTGAAIGPRVIMAGFLDGPGPYAGPSRMLVVSREEAVAAIERYARLGYEQIKVYSSVDPELVPAIVERAHELGLRVSGHVPAFMTAEQVVRMGFDEIQHANFLFLNFLFDTVQDTRTPVRFTAVAEHAAELDLASPPVRSFFALLKERNVAVDPTLNVFESLFTDRPGSVSRAYAAVADRMPAQVRRQFLGGGLPVPEGLGARYRDSFRALLRMVKALHDAGIVIEPGTDALAGFALQRELELYVEAGIPAPEVLRLATLGAARATRHDDSRGVIAPGKLADMILVDGQPDVRISDVRRVVLTVKGGVLHDPAQIYRAIGVEPLAALAAPAAAAGGPGRISRR